MTPIPDPDAGGAALSIRGLSKSFNGNPALIDVALDVPRGEIVSLLGHNGSGKSTLVKCLAGFHRPDGVERLVLYGADLAPEALGRQAAAGRLGFVHQDLGLLPDLSVAENFLLTALRGRKFPHIAWGRVRAGVAEALRRHEVDIGPDTPVAALSQADRCLVAIVRALRDLDRNDGGEAERLLVLDEPTPFLPAAGVDRLFDLMRRFRRSGGSIIFIAHDIDEVMAVSDRIAVLRDGRNAANFVTGAATRDAVVEAIVGRALTFHHVERAARGAAAPPFTVEDLSGDELDGISFTLTPGEILGFTGLIGSGAARVPEFLAGARAPRRGTLGAFGTRISLPGASVGAQMARGVCLLPDDRLRKSGVGDLPLADNIALPALPRFTRAGNLARRALAAHVGAVTERSGVRPAKPALPLGAFSGGNQQKAMIAKWLALEPRILAIAEPTQGVDIGARQSIYAAIEAAARKGTAIACYSSDAGELAQLCDRVLIVARGRIAAELSGAGLTKETITAATLRAADAAPHRSLS